MLCVRCQSGTNRKAGSKNDSVVEKIILPDTIQIYSSVQKCLLKQENFSKGNRLTVYSYINVSCSSCFQYIDKWNENLSFFIRNNVPVIFICYSKDNFELVKYLSENEKINFPFPYIFDTNDKFSQQNPLFKQGHPYQTVLVNKNNEILIFGDPTSSATIMDQYVTVINKK
jgi:hypothetical protein